MREPDPAARERIAATRAFFAPRAATWDDRFPDDGPAYERAVADLAPPPGARVLDAACGTGRALAPLRAAIGPNGTVLGVDLTPEMLEAVISRGRDAAARLVCADVLALPLGDASVDAVFAAGLLAHLPDPVIGLGELARVARPGARLALFHPIGRPALAQRHGRELDSDDVLAPHRIEAVLAATCWRVQVIDDAAHRYLVLAVRR